MAQTRERRENVEAKAESRLLLPQETLTETPAESNGAGGGSDGEKPVREQLKKTSIATLPKYDIAAGDHNLEVEEVDNEAADTHMTTPSSTTVNTAEASTEGAPDGPRAKFQGKRLREEQNSNDYLKDSPEDPPTPSLGGHARKRSRDVRSGELSRAGQDTNIGGSPLAEEDEEEGLEEGEPTVTHEPLTQAPAGIPATSSTENGEATPDDHYMQETIQSPSPKKKRSREDFDSSQSQREQKIAATDENRRRRSSEERLAQPSPVLGASEKLQQATSASGHAFTGDEDSGKIDTTTSSSKIPSGSGFANTSAVSPFGSLSGSKSSEKASVFGSGTTAQQTQTTNSAFASSGFAALSGSAMGFGASAKPSTSSAIPSLTAAASPFGAIASDKIAEKPKIGFGNAGSSGFASTGASAFSGATFGSSFAGKGGFGGGGLSSFAAPIGDAKFGSGKPKAFGATEDSEGEEDGSEGEEDPSKEVPIFSSEDRPDPKFQVSDVRDTGEENEDTIFVNRGKLYQFSGTSWVERGVGPIKLNVTREKDSWDDEGEEAHQQEKGETDPDKGLISPKTQARLLMRVAATHKVILNSPIFKAMKIELDLIKKTVKFSVPLEGRLVPFQLKMSKEDDLKGLYSEVLALQEIM